MTQLKYLLNKNHESQAEQRGHVSCTNMEDVERLDEKELSNGDFYVGTFKGILPHGKGKYTWSDGTLYDGDWEEGKMTGKGQIFWPSGAKYEGDFSGGYLHGSGTYVTPDGSIYRGTWRMNIRHGFGKKEYCNSDIYEGSWIEGVHEGSGKYSWNNGNTYIGNWKHGKMHGRGVMEWANGDLYDGYWFNGLRHGSGIYRFADGGYYFGTWTRGLKDGKGTFYPAGSKHPPVKKWRAALGYVDSGKGLLAHSSSLNLEDFKVKKAIVKRSISEKITGSGSLRSSGRMSHRTTLSDVNSNFSDAAREIIRHDSSFTMSHGSDDSQSEGQDNDAIVYEREYRQGVCIKEIMRNYAELSHNTKQPNKFHSKRAKKNLCACIFRGKDSHYLLLNLQLGIRYTVGKITPVPNRDVRASDFGDRARITMFFPRKGSQYTPPHKSIDFYWKDYCPMVFRDLRELFKLDAAEYMMSICGGDDGLRELSSPGKSGSIFYLSHDDKFVIKTLKKSELKVLLKMLPDYHNHVKLHENTLITKFFGLHRITLKCRRKVRFMVMGNMFCTELRIHGRYDLKGSIEGRFTPKEKIRENTTLKDCDLSYEFHMDKLLREYLFRQLSLDSHFLEDQGIIDYSLLLGVHFIAPHQLNGLVEPPDAIPNNDNTPDVCGVTSEGECLIPPRGLRLVAHEPSFVDTAPGPHIRGSTMKVRSLGDKEVDLILPSCERLRVQLGVNMPAQAYRKLENEADSVEVELFEVYDVVLYMGIIDILQEYDVRKRAERACKSVKYDPMKISVVDPRLYAKRFINFLQQKVFPEQSSSSS